MAKTKRVIHDPDGAATVPKRQKITHVAPEGEDVFSSGQLRNLLSFDQDLRQSRYGLQSFKKLLDSLISANPCDPNKVDILRQYLQDVSPRNANDDSTYLGDIMEMWSFAAQVHDEGVMSSAAVVLALLLQVLSNDLQLVPHGLAICRTLLQERQLKSITRNLSIEKSKAFVISPTLRLLREAVSLDGGAYAKRIFRARDFTFASLGRNLEISFVGDGADDPRKTSVRTNAIRFFTTCLRYLHADGRKELLAQRELVSHLTYMMKSDAPHVVLEILDSLKTYVLADERIPRDVKLRCFNTKSLVRFLGLYSYTSRGDTDLAQTLVGDKAHEFLLYICTTPSAGVLYPSTGIYPKTSDGEVTISAESEGALAIQGSRHDSFMNSNPVYNFVLSELAQKLKPWSGTKHCELLIAIFKAAPELIADYFVNNRSFTFEPKLTMTWIGYAAFLFNTMTIPIPAFFGDRAQYAKLPPPTSVLLDNILPLPINQKVLLRCLSTMSHLTSFFAVRILVAALEKLAVAVEMLERGARSTNVIWTETVRRLMDAFCQRVPDMKDIVRSYKSIPADQILHRTIASRLLRLYYEVIPRVALAANFDVSPLLVESLSALHEMSSQEPQARGLSTLQLENLVSIAGYSPGMRWFSRLDKPVDGLALSPFTALLRLLCGQEQFKPSSQLKSVLEIVAAENQLVSRGTKLAGLVRALQVIRGPAGKDQDQDTIWLFVDNCACRCAASPIKYVEVLETGMSEGKFTRGDGPLTLLNLAMEEQLPFATRSATREQMTAIARLLSFHLNASLMVGESTSLVRFVWESAQSHFSTDAITLTKLGDKSQLKILGNIPSASVHEDEHDFGNQEAALVDGAKLQQMLDVPQMAGGDTGVLVRWSSQSVDDLVDDNWIPRLMQLLLSEHTHIRKEALTTLLKVAAQAKASSYEEKEQIWLLLSELAESSRPHVDTKSVPSPLVAFAIHALEIIRNPLHALYPKVNRFLTRGPLWSPEKLPLAHDILHGEPSEDDRYYTELTWLLTYLLDGLRTPTDLDVFHKKRWFEKILVLAGNPYLRSNLRSRILRILYRATCIEGGATTLATRFGIFSWLEIQKVVDDAGEDVAVYDALMRRVWERCDQERVRKWSNGSVPMRIGHLEPEKRADSQAT